MLMNISELKSAKIKINRNKECKSVWEKYFIDCFFMIFEHLRLKKCHIVIISRNISMLYFNQNTQDREKTTKNVISF